VFGLVRPVLAGGYKPGRDTARQLAAMWRLKLRPVIDSLARSPAPDELKETLYVTAREDGVLDAVPRLGDTLVKLKGAQKPPAKGSPAYSRFVNRRIGQYLAAGSYHLGLSPNQVTMISALFTACGIAMIGLLSPTRWVSLVVPLLLLAGYALDSADGQLARLTGGGSMGGEWLDHVVDAFKTAALHLAVLVGWYRFADLPDVLLLVPVGFCLVGSGLFFAMWITDAMRRLHPAKAPAPAANDAAGVVRSLLVAPTDYGILALIFVAAADGQMFAVLYTAMFTGTLLFAVAAMPKWFREVSGYSRTA
jgi:phosphatidylglycerophosphate synthase